MSAELSTAEADIAFMRMALEEAAQAAAEGEVPVGAVLVHQGNLVARTHNHVERDKHGFAHAELLAIEEATQKLGMWRLDDCVLYVTKEPCPMCAGAMVNCRLPRLVFGCSDKRTGGAGGALDITHMPDGIHQVSVTSSVLADECLAIIQEFFRKRRQDSSKQGHIND
ncbi:MAG: tRNA adenosine(34) deaminase TadA [Victivallales bacterium]|nr:tRNA adenosine(34) deaminase TadA [Victivallales bacterium]